MLLHYDRTPVTSVPEAVDCYARGEFDSAFRSTVPLLALLHRGGNPFAALLAEMGMTVHNVAVHLENRVPVRGGRGPASQTDAMLICGTRACAVEAKWTEPQYPTVAEWLRAGGESENRKAVLAGWLSYLQPYARRALRSDDFAGVTYQAVHRAASACALGSAPSLAYLLFTPSPASTAATAADLRGSLEKLAAALGHPSDFPLRVIEVEVRPTAAFDALSTLPKGQESTGDAVKAALRAQPLFEFPSLTVDTTLAAATLP